MSLKQLLETQLYFTRKHPVSLKMSMTSQTDSFEVIHNGQQKEQTHTRKGMHPNVTRLFFCYWRHLVNTIEWSDNFWSEIC